VCGLEVTLRTQRITAGCWRIAIIAGLIIALPVFFGLWSLVALGHPPPRYVYVFLIVGLGAYIAVTSLEWIIAAFMGEDDSPSAGHVPAAAQVTPASAPAAPAAPVPASPVVASSPAVAPSATAESAASAPPATASPDAPPAPSSPIDPSKAS